VEKSVIGQEGVDEIAASLDLREFTHASQVSGALDVEILLRRMTEHE
jgi:hypothetical protein